jgi:hypothetical protein
VSTEVGEVQPQIAAPCYVVFARKLPHRYKKYLSGKMKAKKTKEPQNIEKPSLKKL